MMYVLRYRSEVPLNDRPHSATLGRWSTWVEAEDARLRVPLPIRDRLEVVTR